MKTIENEISKAILNCAKSKKATGLIKCEASDGSTGYTGSISYGYFIKRKYDACQLIDVTNKNNLCEMLSNLRDASAKSKGGPWYRLNIRIKNSEVFFDYFFENEPFSSFNDIERDMHGNIPGFIKEKYFNSEIIALMSDAEVDFCLNYFVPTQMKNGNGINPVLLEIYATLDWESDVNNGTMNQYFGRDMDYSTDIPRVDLYEKVICGLNAIGMHDAAKLFEESISLFSHLYPEIDEVRKRLGIKQIEFNEDSDIMTRYHYLREGFEKHRVDFIRKNIKSLEVISNSVNSKN